MRIPLLQDHHSHVSIYSACWRNISHITTVQESLDYLYSLPNKVSVVLGWNSYLYSFSEEDLKKLPPVVVSSTSLHGFAISDRAFELLDDDYRKFILQCQNHSWLEKHMPQLCQFYGSIQDIGEEDINRFFYARAREGIYCLEDMLLANEKSLHTIGNSSFSSRAKFWTDLNGYRKLSVDAQKKIYGIKVFSDGALSSKTAAVYRTFVNGGHGILVYSDSELYNLLIEIWQLNKPVAIHAIGDRAIDQVVNTITELSNNGVCFCEVRIEHAQLITLKTAKKAKKWG